MRSLLPVFALLVSSSFAVAQEGSTPPRTAAEAADRVLTAIEAGDEDALKSLAGSVNPDPWLVAHELWVRGAKAVARRFAAETEGVDTEKLGGYLAGPARRDNDAELHRRLGRVQALLDAGRSEDALELFVDPEPTGRHASEVLRLYAFGLTLQNLRRFPESASAFESAAALAESLGWLRRAHLSIQEASYSAGMASDAPRALALTEESRRLAELRGHRWGIADALLTTGFWLGMLGRRDEALAPLEQGLEIMEELGDLDGTAQALEHLAANRYMAHDYSRADAYGAASLKTVERLGDPARVLNALKLAAYVKKALAEYGAALTLTERALALSRKLGQAPARAKLTTDLGRLYDLLGNRRRALARFGEAETLWRSLARPDKVSACLESRATILADLGRREEAASLLREMLTLGAGEEAAPLVRAVSQANLGRLCLRIGRPEEAIACFGRSRDAAEAAGAPHLAIQATTSIAEVLNHTGAPEKAVPLLREALEQASALGAGSLLLLPTIRVSLSLSLQLTGDLAGARKEVSRALEVSAEAGQLETVTQCRMIRAQLSLIEGDYERAMHDCRRGIEELQGLSLNLAEEQAATTRERFLGLFETGLRAAVLSGDAEEAFRFLERSRADALIEALGGRGALRPAVLPAEFVRLEEEALRAEAKAATVLRESFSSGSEEGRRQARAELESARLAVRQVVERIQREARGPSEIVHPEPASPAGVRSLLGPGEVLVLYALVANEGIAIVLRTGGVELVPLGPTEPIEKECARLVWGGSGGSRGLLISREPKADPLPATSRLAKLVVEPLDLGPEDRRVLVSPHGVLSYVPFGLLLGGRETVYVASGSAYRIVADRPSPGGVGVLALGSPDYSSQFDPRDLTEGGSRRGLPPLPGTEAEAKAVGDLVLLGKKATESALVSALARRPRWRSVHLACHGLVDPDRPTLSALVLTPDEASDGFLTALDVVRMRMPADLVVLSACETGRGQVFKAGGIVGIARAFMHAGSPRVLCSLWKVDDRATEAMMVKFYELWNSKDGGGLPAATALVRAQKFVRSHERWRHPYYWAAWVLWGLP
jgi:tetratricopeptide (TPR) repeat protein